jgi:hypothetical protein
VPLGTIIVGTPTRDTSAQSTRNVAWPSPVNAGDLALVYAVSGSTSPTAINTPSGFFSIDQHSGTSNTAAPNVAMFRRTCNGTESGNLAVSNGGTATVTAGIIIIPGADSGILAIEDTELDDKTVSNNSFSFPSITTVSTDDTIVYVVTGNSTSITSTPLTNYTEAVDRVGTTRAINVGYRENVPTGTNTLTGGGWSGNTKDVGIAVAVKAAGGSVTNSSTSDSAPATDSTAQSMTSARTAADTAAAVDAIARAVTAARTAADTAGAADSVTRSTTRSRVAADTAAAVDTLARTFTGARSVTDTAGTVDSPARALTRSRAQGDTATATDATGRAVVLARVGADSAPAADSTSTAPTVGRSTTDSAPAADSPSRSALTMSRSATDAAPAADTLVRGFGLARSVPETAPADDDTARSFSMSRAVGDSAPAVGDSTSGTSDSGVALFELAPATDVTASQITMARTTVEDAPAVDSVHAHPPQLPADDPRGVIVRNDAGGYLVHNAHRAVLVKN